MAGARRGEHSEQFKRNGCHKRRRWVQRIPELGDANLSYPRNGTIWRTA